MEKGPNIQTCTDLVMKKAHLDWEMQCLQTKIKCKNEENSKLEKQISERKNELEKLKKSVNISCEREEKVKNNINQLRNSRTITEGLLMSMKQQLKILEEKRNDTKNVRKNIIQKYSKLFESYAKIYSNLPWAKKINELKVSVQNRKINLNILKTKYSSFKIKVSLFNRIQDQRIVVAVIRLAKHLVARNNLQKEIEELFNKEKEYQSKIILLKEEKIKLQERIDLKVKEALDEARGRVVKKHVGNSHSEKHPKNVAKATDVVTPLRTNLKPENESIFSRLGISVPYSLSRLLTPSSRILNSVHGLMEEQLKKQDIPATEKFNKVEDKCSSSEVRKDKQTTEEKSNSTPQGLKRPSTASSNISEKIPCLMGVTQRNEIPAIEKVRQVQKKVQTVEEKGNVSNNEKSEKVQHVTVSEPSKSDKLDSQKETTKNKSTTSQTEKKNKKLKKKVKINSNSEAKSSVQVSENSNSCIPGNDQNVVVSEELPRVSTNEPISKPISPEIPVTASPDISTEKETSLEKPTTKPVEGRPTEPVEEIVEDETILNDPEMNHSNLSALDNISVVSSTFTNENRNQMTKSPDFLSQNTQGYCFSPLNSPSKPDNISEVSSIKGVDSPSKNFPTSIASPLSPMDAQPVVERSIGHKRSPFVNYLQVSQNYAMPPLGLTYLRLGRTYANNSYQNRKRTRPINGPQSDFSSFFGASSPKKSESSSKNFFQLFG